MPNPTIKSFAKKSGKSVNEVEKMWDEAYKIAIDTLGKNAKDDKLYAYTVGVLKKMLNLKESYNLNIKEFLNYKGSTKEYLKEKFKDK